MRNLTGPIIGLIVCAICSSNGNAANAPQITEEIEGCRLPVLSSFDIRHSSFY